MEIYLTTDTHFHHERIKVLSGRPDDFEYKILESFIGIKETDLLIHLGDICIGKDKEAHLEFISYAMCRKWLVKGNHDNKSNHWYLQNGWDFVGESFIIKQFGKRIAFSHKPLPVSHLDCCDINIHGHFHNVSRDDRQYEFPHVKYKLLSIEDLDYKFIKLSEIINRTGGEA